MSSEQDTIVQQAVEHLICPSEGSIRIATKADAESLFLLINKAFFQILRRYKREAFQNRMETVDEVHKLMEKGIFLILTATDHEQSIILNDGCFIVACIFMNHAAFGELPVEIVDAKLSLKINLLAVHPGMVRRGIGQYMMQAVESMAKIFRYTHVFLPVVSVNKHLVHMYTKWGFKIIDTKTLADCGIDAEKFSVPCHMIMMEKELL
ncbi:unnamed protein product [Rotaria socialis]|uniref:N-acetyltransferase domain-containing protein n=1 Tax=Rotaria socialis TaxID=392032 RepID=A0A820VN06_9BILA|nr:unnamed protein product [Rotaria socialis]CAF4503134.1 unnamed protein product [Rotaria socialis]